MCWMSTISIEGEKTNGSKGFALGKLFIGMIVDAKVVQKGELFFETAIEEGAKLKWRTCDCFDWMQSGTSRGARRVIFWLNEP